MVEGGDGSLSGDSIVEALLSGPRDLAIQRMRGGKSWFVVLTFAPHAGQAAVLSRAEGEVVQAALRGESTARIAGARRTTQRTVSNQLASAFAKLGVRSRAELAAAFSTAAPRVPQPRDSRSRAPG